MFGFLRRSEEHPRRSVALRRRVGLPCSSEAEGPKRLPQLRYGIAWLRRGVAWLRRSGALFTKAKFLDFVSKHLIFVH